jgi:hypothetical protein
MPTVARPMAAASRRCRIGRRATASDTVRRCSTVSLPRARVRASRRRARRSRSPPPHIWSRSGHLACSLHAARVLAARQSRRAMSDPEADATREGTPSAVGTRMRASRASSARQGRGAARERGVGHGLGTRPLVRGSSSRCTGSRSAASRGRSRRTSATCTRTPLPPDRRLPRRHRAARGGDRLALRRAGIAGSVTDTGPGVPAEKQGAIFEPFVEVGRSLSSSTRARPPSRSPSTPSLTNDRSARTLSRVSGESLGGQCSTACRR